ncbi:RNA polymerase sigma factor [Pseudoalteromonas sp. C2R02]|uniref:RNA polymerase sigma factor n=1 Tax=Pseudoalteromonas sp. C2R02 TaxID=2841565 RepID=UPI001C08241B|nr:RNA polymerase sigma factor [Pseudoalteromonas sp. C2R02]MBU2972124.1 RNA polymerase sigma factor [Pseudoalteromonas sp. C2R02]
MLKIGFQKQLSQVVIDQAIEGDMSALEVVYLTYADACFSLAYRISQDQTLAQDIVHEAFIKIMNKICNFNNDGSFAGWIRRILVNETINRVKSNSILKLVADTEVEESASNDLFDFNWLITCHDLDEILKNLPTQSRAVLLLHQVEGYTHKEIADLYGKSESYSKVTLSRAYKSLKLIVLEQEKYNAFK